MTIFYIFNKFILFMKFYMDFQLWNSDFYIIHFSYILILSTARWTQGLISLFLIDWGWGIKVINKYTFLHFCFRFWGRRCIWTDNGQFAKHVHVLSGFENQLLHIRARCCHQYSCPAFTAMTAVINCRLGTVGNLNNLQFHSLVYYPGSIKHTQRK